MGINQVSSLDLGIVCIFRFIEELIKGKNILCDSRGARSKDVVLIGTMWLEKSEYRIKCSCAH